MVTCPHCPEQLDQDQLESHVQREHTHDWAANHDADLPLIRDYCRRCRSMRLFTTDDVCQATVRVA